MTNTIRVFTGRSIPGELVVLLMDRMKCFPQYSLRAVNGLGEDLHLVFDEIDADHAAKFADRLLHYSQGWKDAQQQKGNTV